MLIRIDSLLRERRRLLAVAAALLLALALLATHSAATAGHGSGHHQHDGVSTPTVVTLCLAILEAGVALALVAMLAARSGRLTLRLPAPPRITFATVPEAARLGPPGTRAPLLQVFLR